jgi:hypothetical protein
MNPKIASIVSRLKSLEDELEAELALRRAELRYTVRKRTIRFEREVVHLHRRLKTRVSRYVLGARPLIVLTAPFIYAVMVPLVLLDLFVTLYQTVCFPVYGIPKVERHKYIAFDRHHLAYLNGVEKLNCAYCAYANGLVAYVREIAGRTEQYWCPIKHAIRVRATHEHYRDFVDYGDARAYHEELESLRKEIQDLKSR